MSETEGLEHGLNPTFWLVETAATDNSPARWWHPERGWCVDWSKALRFARKEDAEDFAYSHHMRGCLARFASEHRLLDLAQAGASRPVGGEEAYELVKEIGRLDHTADDGYYPPADDLDSVHVLDSLIAKARDIMATRRTPASRPLGDREEIAREAAFLLDRLGELDWSDPGDLEREWHGHVTPSIARLRALLSSSEAAEDDTP